MSTGRMARGWQRRLDWRSPDPTAAPLPVSTLSPLLPSAPHRSATSLGGLEKGWVVSSGAEPIARRPYDRGISRLGLVLYGRTVCLPHGLPPGLASASLSHNQRASACGSVCRAACTHKTASCLSTGC